MPSYNTYYIIRILCANGFMAFDFGNTVAFYVDFAWFFYNKYKSVCVCVCVRVYTQIIYMYK